MSKEQAKLQIKAAAWAAAAAIGINEAVKLLQSTAAELQNTQWEGPNNR